MGQAKEWKRLDIIGIHKDSGLGLERMIAVDEKLLNELINDTTIYDIHKRYREIVRLIGIRNFTLLSNYARGDELYFPKAESVLAPARNRKIKQEFNGFNSKELARKYNLTVKQIHGILKYDSPIGQISLEDFNDDD